MERVEYTVVACWFDESDEASQRVITEFGIADGGDRYYGLDLSTATALADKLESEGYFDVELREFSVTMF